MVFSILSTFTNSSMTYDQYQDEVSQENICPQCLHDLDKEEVEMIEIEAIEDTYNYKGNHVQHSSVVLECPECELVMEPQP
jgi:rubredoxin